MWNFFHLEWSIVLRVLPTIIVLRINSRLCRFRIISFVVYRMSCLVAFRLFVQYLISCRSSSTGSLLDIKPWRWHDVWRRRRRRSFNNVEHITDNNYAIILYSILFCNFFSIDEINQKKIMSKIDTLSERKLKLKHTPQSGEKRFLVVKICVNDECLPLNILLHHLRTSFTVLTLFA